MQTNMLINGELVAGEGTSLPVYNPHNGQEIVRLAQASEQQTKQAVDQAHRAFTDWGQTTPKTRSELLLALADRIEANAEALAQLESGSRQSVHGGYFLYRQCGDWHFRQPVAG